MVSIRSVTPHSLSPMAATVLWVRRDLRLRDHPALCEAAAAGGKVLPLFVLDPRLADEATPRRDHLLASLRCLDEAMDGALVVRRGRPEQVVSQVAREAGADSVHTTAESTPYGRARDERVRRRLQRDGRSLVATGTPYAVGPGTLLKADGTPYQVFTPFSRAWRDHGWPGPAPMPRGLRWARTVDSGGIPDGRDCRGCRRGDRSAEVEAVPRRAPGRLRRRARPARPRHDEPHVRAAEVRRDPPADTARRHRQPRGGAQPGGPHLRQRAVLAGVLRRRPVAPPDVRLGRPQAGPVLDGVLRARCWARGVAEGRAPATPSSTPACASCSRRGGCTTGCG